MAKKKKRTVLADLDVSNNGDIIQLVLKSEDGSPIQDQDIVDAMVTLFDIRVETYEATKTIDGYH